MKQACNVCGAKASQVCASGVTAQSFAYCEDCLREGAEPFGALACALVGSSARTRSQLGIAMRRTLEATLKHTLKTEPEFWRMVGELEREMEQESEMTTDPNYKRNKAHGELVKVEDLSARDKLERAVELALDRLNVERVHRVMCALDWRWRDASSPPTRDEIRESATRLAATTLARLFELDRENFWTRSGGFEVRVERTGEVEILFVAESVEVEAEETSAA